MAKHPVQQPPLAGEAPPFASCQLVERTAVVPSTVVPWALLQESLRRGRRRVLIPKRSLSEQTRTVLALPVPDKPWAYEAGAEVRGATADWPSQADKACWPRKVQTSRPLRPVGMLSRNEGMPHPFKDPEECPVVLQGKQP